jgi:hypothetical protein
MARVTDSSVSGADSRTDTELTAEIAPAMLKKLHADGRRFGLALGLPITPLMGIWLQSTDVLGNSNKWIIFLAMASGLIVQFDALPRFSSHRSVRAELRHRRLYGKWRWER